MAQESDRATELAAKLDITREEVKQLKDSGLSEDEIDRLSGVPLRVALEYAKGHAGIDRPLARLLWRRQTLLDAAGEISPGAREHAHRQVQQMHAEAGGVGVAPRSLWAGMPLGPLSTPHRYIARGTSAGLHHDNSGWTALGPWNVGGRIRSIAIDPENSKTLWAGGVDGGVWRTDDAGENWVPTQDLMGNLAVCALALGCDPSGQSASRLLYAGTGESVLAYDGLPGNGIFVSRDGWTWEQIPATNVSETNRDFEFVMSLAVSKDGKTILAGTANGISRLECNKMKEAWQWQVGSVDDTSQKKDTQLGYAGIIRISDAPCLDVAFDPLDGKSLRAVAGTVHGTALYSDDGGKKWKKACWDDGQPERGRVALCYSAGVPRRVYASVFLGGNEPSRVYVSIDGGRKYFKRSATIDRTGSQASTSDERSDRGGMLGNQGNYDNVIWAGDPATRDQITEWSATASVAASAWFSATDDDQPLLFFQADATGGTTGSTEPKWPTVLGDTVTDGDITWTADVGPELVIVGGIDLYRSIDGGDKFKPISNYSIPSSVHADHHAIVADPDFGKPILDNKGKPTRAINKPVYFGNDGGVYHTDNVTGVGISSGWKKLENYSLTQFYSVAAHPSGAILAGAQDNGTRALSPGETNWDDRVVGGDGTCVAVDPSKPVQRITEGRRPKPTLTTTWYGAKPHLDIFRAERKEIGTNPNWTHVDIAKGTKILEAGVWDARTDFAAPFVLDPVDPKVMYAGAKSLWMTLDAKSTPVDWHDTGTPTSGSNITAIAVRSTSENKAVRANVALVGTSKGDVYRTWNLADAAGQVKWTPVGGPIHADRRCMCLAIDPREDAAGCLTTFYAGFGGYGAVTESGNVWKTVDGGRSWCDVSGGRIQAPVFAIAIHPENPDWIYLGTELGIFASENAGRDWSANNEGPANVACFDLAWCGSTLLCATHGRGIFQIDLTLREAETLLVGDLEGILHAIVAETGVARRQRELSKGGELSEILIVDSAPAMAHLPQDVVKHLRGSAFLGDSAGKLWGIGSSTLEPWWRAEVDAGVTAAPQLYLHPADRKLYLLVATADGTVEAFDLHALPADAEDGRARLAASVDLKAGEMKIESFQVMDNWAYVGSDKGVFMLNLLTTSPKGIWQPSLEKSVLDAQCTAPILLAANRLYVPAKTCLRALEARTGKQPSGRWPVDGRATTRPVWCMGAVAFGTADGEVIGVDHVTGRERFCICWDLPPIGALAAQDNVLFAAVPGFLMAFGIAPLASGRWQHELLWKMKVASPGLSVSPVVVGNQVFVTGSGGIQAFDTAGGSAWSTSSLGKPTQRRPGVMHKKAGLHRRRERVSIVLAIDRSGSMADEAYDAGTFMDAAKHDAAVFISLMQEFDQLAVIDFDDVVTVDYPGGGNALKTLCCTSEIDAACKTLEDLSARNRTAIGDALVKAKTLFAASSSPNRAIILLSDGKSNEGLPPTDAVKGCPPVYAVGLGSAADVETLTEIATRTDGEYHRVDSPEGLHEVYNEIASKTNIAKLLAHAKADPQSGVSPSVDVTIPPSQSHVLFLVNWRDPQLVYTDNDTPASGQISVRIQGPAGFEGGKKAAFAGRGFAVLRLERVQAGRYTATAKFSGTTTSPRLDIAVFDPRALTMP